MTYKGLWPRPTGDCVLLHVLLWQIIVYELEASAEFAVLDEDAQSLQSRTHELPTPRRAQTNVTGTQSDGKDEPYRIAVIICIIALVSVVRWLFMGLMIHKSLCSPAAPAPAPAPVKYEAVGKTPELISDADEEFVDRALLANVHISQNSSLLPEGWQTAVDENGLSYYWRSDNPTATRSWIHPSDLPEPPPDSELADNVRIPPNSAPLPTGWQKAIDQNGRSYYWRPDSPEATRSWIHPSSMDSPRAEKQWV